MFSRKSPNPLPLCFASLALRVLESYSEKTKKQGMKPPVYLYIEMVENPPKVILLPYHKSVTTKWFPKSGLLFPGQEWSCDWVLASGVGTEWLYDTLMLALKGSLQDPVSLLQTDIWSQVLKMAEPLSAYVSEWLHAAFPSSSSLITLLMGFYKHAK